MDACGLGKYSPIKWGCKVRWARFAMEQKLSYVMHKEELWVVSV